MGTGRLDEYIKVAGRVAANESVELLGDGDPEWVEKDLCPACNQATHECRCFELDAVEAVRQQMDVIKQRDETIRQLRAEIERLANLLESAGDRLEVPGGQYQGEWMHAAAARRLLVRLEREE